MRTIPFVGAIFCAALAAGDFALYATLQSPLLLGAAIFSSLTTLVCLALGAAR